MFCGFYPFLWSHCTRVNRESPRVTITESVFSSVPHRVEDNGVFYGIFALRVLWAFQLQAGESEELWVTGVLVHVVMGPKPPKLEISEAVSGWCCVAVILYQPPVVTQWALRRSCRFPTVGEEWHSHIRCSLGLSAEMPSEEFLHLIFF